MKQSNVIFFGLFLLMPSMSSVWAQVSASPYSYYGLGIMRNRMSPLNRAISGTGIGDRDPYHLNTTNPASLNAIQGVSYLTNIGFFYERGSYKTRKDQTQYSSGNLTSIDFWFRFNSRWSSAVGVAPIGFTDYSVLASANYVDLENKLLVSGKGILYQIYWSHAFQLAKHVSLGVTGGYIRGSANLNEKVQSGLLGLVNYSENRSMRAFCADVGIQYERELPNDASLSMGLVYKGMSPLNVLRSAELSQSSNIFGTYDLPDEKRKLPFTYGLGAGLRTNQWNVAMDVEYKDWKNTFVDNSQSNVRSTFQWSVGSVYKLSSDISSLKNLYQLRAGVYVEENYLILRKTSFMDWGASLGVVVPVADNRGFFHFTYQYNRTGTLRKALIDQWSGVFIVDFTYRDVWGASR